VSDVGFDVFAVESLEDLLQILLVFDQFDLDHLGTPGPG
jgi:hypothetical protein